MRIAICTHFYPPHHLGGTEVLTAGLAKHLQMEGHDVQVVCGEDWERAGSHEVEPSDDVVDGVPVHRLHFNWKKAPDVFGWLYNNPNVEAYVIDYFESFQPDIVHITSCYTLSASIISAANVLGIPIVLTATDFWFLCSRNTLLMSDGSLCSGPDRPMKCTSCMMANSPVYDWSRKVMPEWALLRTLSYMDDIPLITNQPWARGALGDWEKRVDHTLEMLGLVDRIVTASQFLRDLFIQYGVDPKKISVSPYGIDTSWATGFERKQSSAHLRVGFIGQMLPMKGPDILLRALSLLHPQLPIEVHLYGDPTKDPDYGQMLTALAARDPRVKMAGTFSNRDMGAVLQRLDVLIVPSIWYDFPLVIPSAFATRTPVIATDLSGMNEFVQHEVNGLLFERNCAEDLATTIQRLVDEPGLLPRLRSGIQPVRTIANMAGELSAMSAKLVEAPRSRIPVSMLAALQFVTLASSLLPAA